MQNALEVIGLQKKYRDFTLRDVSFGLPKGSIMGFIGPNGAGKTTTIKSILNLIRYDAGEVKIFGQKQNINEKSNDIGVVADSSFYESEWTMDNVGWISSLFYDNWNKTQFYDLLKKFEIDRKKKVGELSKGMNVKLMFASAMSHSAKILILDEPTSGLDPVARDEVCDMLAEYARGGGSVLFSTHITSDLEKCADYITYILGGGIIFSGKKQDIIEKYVKISGDTSKLTQELKKLIIGKKELNNNIEGLLIKENASLLPKDITISPALLDDIVVCLNEERKHA